MSENIQLYPARTRVVPNIKLIKVLAKQSAGAYQKLLDGKSGGVIEKKNHKKHGEVITTYTITNAEGYDGTDPLNEFDRAVLSACISEFEASNKYTTIAILLRSLTGKVGGSDGAVYANQREWILNSLHKLMSTIITVDLADTNEKLNYEGADTVTGAILPCKYVTTTINGQPVKDVIYFLDESPIMKIAKDRNQILRYDTELLDVPNLRKTPLVITITNYIMNRVTEIKLHKQLAPTLTFADIFEKARITNASRDAKYNAREIVITTFKHLQAKEVIKTFDVVKKGVAVHAITFTF